LCPIKRDLTYLFITLLQVVMRKNIVTEYLFKASPTIVYSFLTTPACLVRWFCDSVDILGDVYTFEWQGYVQQAKLEVDIEDEYLKFVWMDGDNEGETLEYRISTSPITNETILTITDFADEGDTDSQAQLWDSQIKAMKQEMGV
jgi:uncharacterized protein YndB with AHSA1/START domain